jgi:hypothetical protein
MTPEFSDADLSPASPKSPHRPPRLRRLFAPLLLAAASALLWLLAVRGAAGPDATFDPYALTELVWYLFAALGAVLILAAATRPRLGLRWSLVLLASLAPLGVLVLLSLLLPGYFPALLASAAALAGTGLALLLGTRRLLGRWQPAAVLAAVAWLAVFTLSGHYFYFPAQLWIAAEQDPAPRSAPAAMEALLFSQPARIDQALQRLGPRDLQPSAFFVGFAGYAEEKVFAEEVRFAAKVMDARYGSGQRTLFLLNDQRDRQRQPLATASGLRYALNGIARQMQRDEDLLILVLSSHGGEQAELAVSNGDLPLATLDGPLLRAALDDAGIRWRLIVLSACFAGSFLEHLATPETVLITAAAPDRTSFGCSNDRDLTYFGEAFLRDALPGATDLESAFTEAIDLVTDREQALGVTPSRPVAHFGKALAQRLDQGTWQAQR